MVENKKNIGEFCIDKETKNEANQSQSVSSSTHFGDNATSRKSSNLIEITKAQLHQKQHQAKEVTVIGVDQNQNANSTIDSRACHKPVKKNCVADSRGSIKVSSC